MRPFPPLVRCHVVDSVFGKPVAQEGSLEAIRSLEQHIVHVLGAESLDRWTIEVRLSTEYSRTNNAVLVLATSRRVVYSTPYDSPAELRVV